MSSFSWDGASLATGRWDKILQADLLDVWEVSTGNLRRTINMGRCSVQCLKYHPNKPLILIVTSGSWYPLHDNSDADDIDAEDYRDEVLIADVEAGETTYLCERGGHAAVSPDGLTIAMLHNNHRSVVELFSWECKPIQSIKIGRKAIQCLAFSGDSRSLAAGCTDGSFNIISCPKTQNLNSETRMHLDLGDFVTIRNQRQAFAMGLLERLGEASVVQLLDRDIVTSFMEYL